MYSGYFVTLALTGCGGRSGRASDQNYNVTDPPNATTATGDRVEGAPGGSGGKWHGGSDYVREGELQVGKGDDTTYNSVRIL